MIDPALATILKPADILLVGRSGFISRAIKEVTRSRWSHTLMIGLSHGAFVEIEATTDVRPCQ